MAYAPLFDPKEYITGTPVRHPRWRIEFNGLGDLHYCPIVRRTPGLEALLAQDLLGEAVEFAQSVGQAMLDRALAWAYLSETEGSFAIEGEAPSEDKARLFVRLLQQAHDRRPLSEEYLVELQNSAVTNPFDKAVQFRTEQNRLQGPARGAAGVTYLPPPPELSTELMERLMAQANAGPGPTDPLVKAAVTSFGFVLIHPFMDGNGRLHRFLFHHALCQSGRLPNGFLLPVSMAMKRHEDDYLAALQTFSRPARELWEVKWLGGEDYVYTASPGIDAIYRYWDATPCVEFALRMTQMALEHDLQREAQFLAGYDKVLKEVNARFDVRGPDLATLILCCSDQGGKLSKGRRRQFAGRVQEPVFDFIEQQVQRWIPMSGREGADVLENKEGNASDRPRGR